MANWKRKVCFLGKAWELHENKRQKTEGLIKYRNVKEYQRVVYSKCREDGAYTVSSTTCKSQLCYRPKTH